MGTSCLYLSFGISSPFRTFDTTVTSGKVVDKPPSQHNKQILLFISDKLLESSGKYCTFC